MKQQWVWFGIWAWALGFGGCGGEEEKSPLDPSTFAGMNADKVSYDCQHTVQCAAQNSEPLVDDPIDTCIEETARLLEANPDKRMLYLSNVTRCQMRVVCDYKACALADAQNTYGQSQIDKVTYDCQQEVECRRLSNMVVSDPVMETQSCIGNNVGLLDTFTTDQRAQYEVDFAACTGRVACDFTSCFLW